MTAHASQEALTEVSTGIFRLRCPLPFRLDHINLYLLVGSGPTTLVDTGTRTGQAYRAMTAGLGALGMSVTDLRYIFLTHFHGDHSGSAGRLQRESGAAILMDSLEAELLCRFMKLPDEFFDTTVATFYRQLGLGDERIA